jgi:sensor histidine kinase YesM
MWLGGLYRDKRFRQALALTLTIWMVFVYGSYVVSSLIAGRTAFLADLPLDLPAVLIVALIAQLLYPVVNWTAGMSPVSRWLILIAATLAVAFVQSFVNTIENRMLGVIPSLDMQHFDLIRDRYGRNFLSHVYVSFANAALLVFVVEAQRSAEQRIRLARTEAIAARARTAALRLQLNPHFLFNTLNSISSLVVTGRSADAEEMLGRLSDFLRLSLNADPHALVPLEEEFATIETYLDIEAVRFGARMTVELSCPPDVADEPVPGFILQPLVENAVKYGVARSPGPVSVRVIATREGAVLKLCVSDTGTAAPDDQTPCPSGFGIGLDNIRERLASRYAARGSLSTERDAQGFTAIVRMPVAAVAGAGPAT